MSRDEVVDDVLRAIRRILRKTSEHARYFSRETGLSAPQALCLRAIAAAPDEATAVRVSHEVQLSPATVSRILERLESEGLVARTRCSGDRRQVRLTLTDEGRRRLESLPTPLQERFVERLLKLPKARQRELLKSLQTVVSLMEAESLDAAPMLEPGVDVKPTAAAAAEEDRRRG